MTPCTIFCHSKAEEASGWTHSVVSTLSYVEGGEYFPLCSFTCAAFFIQTISSIGLQSSSRPSLSVFSGYFSYWLWCRRTNRYWKAECGLHHRLIEDIQRLAANVEYPTLSQEVESVLSPLVDGLSVSEWSSIHQKGNATHHTGLQTTQKLKKLETEKPQPQADSQSDLRCVYSCILCRLLVVKWSKVFPLINTSIFDLINLSLLTGYVPQTFKVAVMKPLLKKPTLDSEVLQPEFWWDLTGEIIFLQI